MTLPRRTEWVLDTEGRGVNGASVAVYNSETGALVSLFSDTGGVDPLPNPITTSQFGEYSYCAAYGMVYETIRRPGYDTITIQDISLGIYTGNQGPPGPRGQDGRDGTDGATGATGPAGAPATSTVTPLTMTSGGAIGTSAQAARADHRHPNEADIVRRNGYDSVLLNSVGVYDAADNEWRFTGTTAGFAIVNVTGAYNIMSYNPVTFMLNFAFGISAGTVDSADGYKLSGEDILVGQLGSIAAATDADVVSKFNTLISGLKAAKLMAT